MNSNKRKNGFYFVMINDTWEVMYYLGDVFYRNGHMEPLQEIEIDKVGELIKLPQG